MAKGGRLLSTKYKHFTDEQKETARQTDLVELLQSQGETLKRAGSEYDWYNGGQKITIRGNLWYNQYEQEGGDAIDFARGLLGGAGGATLHMLVCGEPLAPDGGEALVGAEVEEAGGVREWASSVESLLRVLCPGDAPLAARIASGVRSFVRAAGPSTEPFRWSRASPAATAARATAAIAPGTVEVTARVMGDDGEWVSFTSSAESGVTQSGFGLTPRGYVDSLGLVERAVLSAGREAQRGATEAYLASVVKKTPWGAPTATAAPSTCSPAPGC